MYTAIQSAIAVDFTLYKKKLLLNYYDDDDDYDDDDVSVSNRHYLLQ